MAHGSVRSHGPWLGQEPHVLDLTTKGLVGLIGRPVAVLNAAGWRRVFFGVALVMATGILSEASAAQSRCVDSKAMELAVQTKEGDVGSLCSLTRSSPVKR